MSDRQDGSSLTSNSEQMPPPDPPSEPRPPNSERLDRIEELLTESGEDLKFPTAVVRVFGIQCALMETYFTVLDNPQSTSGELADILDYDRDGLNQYLRQLHEKGLVRRRRAVDGKAGRAYTYTAKPLDETIEWMQSELEAWTEDVIEELSQLREQYPENSESSNPS